jgi:hypothetical protein
MASGRLSGDRLLDGRHLVDVAGLLPVGAVVRQQGVMHEPATQQRLCRFHIFRNADRQHVADQKIRIAALGYDLTFSTNARMSDSGLPGVTPRRWWVGPWAIPMPKRKRPPETSCR